MGLVSLGDPTSPIRSQLVNYALLLPKLWNQTDPNTLCPPWYKARCIFQKGERLDRRPVAGVPEWVSPNTL